MGHTEKRTPCGITGCISRESEPTTCANLGITIANILHNFKYFTWVEQQGRSADDLRRLWNEDFWAETFSQVDDWDRRITEFNRSVA